MPDNSELRNGIPKGRFFGWTALKWQPNNSVLLDIATYFSPKVHRVFHDFFIFDQIMHHIFSLRSVCEWKKNNKKAFTLNRASFSHFNNKYEKKKILFRK